MKLNKHKLGLLHVKKGIYRWFCMKCDYKLRDVKDWTRIRAVDCETTQHYLA